MVGSYQTGVLMCSVRTAASQPVIVIGKCGSLASSSHVTRKARNPDFCETPRSYQSMSVVEI